MPEKKDLDGDASVVQVPVLEYHFLLKLELSTEELCRKMEGFSGVGIAEYGEMKQTLERIKKARQQDEAEQRPDVCVPW